MLTPHEYTRLIKLLRGALQKEPLSPLLLLVIVELLIRRLKALNNGCALTSNHLTLYNKWYAGDATLVASKVTDLNTQLDTVNTFGVWSSIRLNTLKCILASFIHALQLIKLKAGRGTAFASYYDQRASRKHPIPWTLDILVFSQHKQGNPLDTPPTGH